jgi:hypothetical protein
MGAEHIALQDGVWHNITSCIQYITISICCQGKPNRKAFAAKKTPELYKLFTKKPSPVGRLHLCNFSFAEIVRFFRKYIKIVNKLRKYIG